MRKVWAQTKGNTDTFGLLFLGDSSRVSLRCMCDFYWGLRSKEMVLHQSTGAIGRARVGILPGWCPFASSLFPVLCPPGYDADRLIYGQVKNSFVGMGAFSPRPRKWGALRGMDGLLGEGERAHCVMCARCAKVGYLRPVFLDGKGDRGNHCFSIHRTAQILTQSKNSDNELKQPMFHTENARLLSVF